MDPIPDLSVEQIETIRYCVDRLVPGQKMYVQKGIPIYHAVEHGVTRKGVQWVNSHIAYRENATHSIRERALPYLVGNGLDAGCGIEKVTPGCVGIDSGMDYENRTDADDLRDASDLTGYDDDSFDWVFSSNALEHIGPWEKALTEWCRVVRPGGIIFLYLPWPDKCPPHSPEQTPHHLWSPSPEILDKELILRGFNVVERDDTTDRWGCFVIVGRKNEK